MAKLEDCKNGQFTLLPLTSSQKWLMGELKKLNKPGWCSVEFLVKTSGEMNVDIIKETANCIVNKYETLRAKIVNIDGEWTQQVYPASEADPFDFFDLSTNESSSKCKIMRQVCMKERDWLLPSTGNLFRIIYFKYSENEGRLWFCMHHVISDFVSALILSNEFMTVYKALEGGVEQIKLDTDYNYRKMMYILDGYCRDVLLPNELEYWISFPWEHAKMLPTDFPEDFPDVNVVLDAFYNKKLLKSFKVCTTEIEEERTFKLFGRYNSDIETLIVSIFFLSVSKCMNIDCLDFNVCNSGRNILPPCYGINISKLLGFLSVSRVILLKSPDATDIRSAITDVISQIKKIPNLGVGYYLITDFIKDKRIRESFRNLRKPCFIFFNYLGRSDSNFGNDQYRLIEEDTGLIQNETEIRSNLLECFVSIKKNKLVFDVTYTSAYFKESTIEALSLEIASLCQTLCSDILKENIER